MDEGLTRNASLWKGSGSREENCVFKRQYLFVFKVTTLKKTDINVLAYPRNINGQDIYYSVGNALKVNTLMGELGHALFWIYP